MKKEFSLAVLFFILAIALSLPAHAGEIEIATDDGSLRVTDAKNWRGTKVTIDDDVLAYGEKWKEAYRNPGKTVPVVTRRTHATSGWLEVTVTTSADVAVRYDKDARAVHLVANAGIVETETQFNPFLVFAIAAMLLMLLSILLARKQDAVAAFAAAFAAAFVAAFAAAFVAAFVAFVAAFVAFVAAFVAAFAAEYLSPRWYWFFLAIFYACIALSVYLTFFN